VSALLTVDQVAERLQTSRWFVYAHGQELGLVKVGGANRYLPERVDAYIAEAATVQRIAHLEAPNAAAAGEPLVQRSTSDKCTAHTADKARQGKRPRIALLEPRPKRGVAP
jgi:hypothetical protein